MGRLSVVDYNELGKQEGVNGNLCMKNENAQL